MSDPKSAAATALALSPVLRVLDEASRLRLIAAGSPVELVAGEMLFLTGDDGDVAFVVLSGELEIRTLSAMGREVRIGGLGPGALVGEMAVIDGDPRSADVTAQRRTRLWRLPRAAFVAALEANPKTALALLAELSRRLRATNNSLESSRLLDLGARLAGLLAEVQSDTATISMTQTEMARRLGYSREKVNRKLNAWARLGWIKIGPSGVRILDASKISSEAGTVISRSSQAALAQHPPMAKAAPIAP